jgi:glutathione S-transferase
MMQSAPRLEAWFQRVDARPSAQATVPPPMPGRG